MNILFGEVGSEVTFFSALVRIVLSITIGTIVGYEREKKNKSAGLKTHVLVCLAASLIATVEQQMIYKVATLSSSAINVSFGRLTVGVITGVGFLGAGTISMSKSKIVGLTTAASLWCTACLGLINGMGFCFIALIASILVTAILETFKFGDIKNLNRIIEIKFLNTKKTTDEIEKTFNELGIDIKDYAVAFYREDKKKYCITRYSIIFESRQEIINVMSKLADIDNVDKVEIENVL